MHLLTDYYESIGVHISQRQIELETPLTKTPSGPSLITRLLSKLTFRSPSLCPEEMSHEEHLALDTVECQ